MFPNLCMCAQIQDVVIKRDFNQSSVILNFIFEDSRRGVFHKNCYKFDFVSYDKALHAFKLLNILQKSGRRFLDCMHESPLKYNSFQGVLNSCARIHSLDAGDSLDLVRSTDGLFIVQSGTLLIFWQVHST